MRAGRAGEREAESSESAGARGGASRAPPEYGVSLVDALLPELEHEHVGTPLPASERASMEGAFGRSFAGVRVHDDAHAHASARALGARAYALGQHVVFGAGEARRGGASLLAHELAHVVQQSSAARPPAVQRSPASLAPPRRSLAPPSSPRLEAEADAAAQAVVEGQPVPELSRVTTPTIQRTTTTPPTTPPTPPSPPTPPPTGGTGLGSKLPAHMTAILDDPPGVGTTQLIVKVSGFSLPAEKGKGAWVQEAYDIAGDGGRLVFSPLITPASAGRAETIAAYKEDSDSKTYKTIWLRKFGFKTTAELATAFTSSSEKPVVDALADPGVKKLIDGMKVDLASSGCDIDHIVEKQLGGTSAPDNLQLLDSNKNQESGRKTYEKLVAEVGKIRDPSMRGPAVMRLQLRFDKIQVPSGTSDPSFVVEDLLRRGLVKGANYEKTKVGSNPVGLIAGGFTTLASVLDTGETAIRGSAAFAISGMRLQTYKRGSLGPKSPIDKVEAQLDNAAVVVTAPAASKLTLDAKLEPATTTGATPPATAVTPPATGATPPTTGATPPATGTTPPLLPNERRTLSLVAAHPQVKFYYPYLSPGALTKLSLGPSGLEGTGTITPTVPILNKLAIKYTPTDLALVAPLDASKLAKPHPAFRFTKGELALKLSPTLIPTSTLEFEIGPIGKPIVLGKLDAKLVDGAFVARADLTLGAKVPGISAASGSLEYHSVKGWSGAIKATSTPLPDTTIDVELGFLGDADGKLQPYGKGGLHTKIRDTALDLTVGWSGDALSYKGGVKITKPIPQVPSVELTGGYANGTLSLSGKTSFKWKQFTADDITIRYTRKDGEAGKLSGDAHFTIDLKDSKGAPTGTLDMHFDEGGNYWGKGTVAYSITKDIRPTLGIELTKQGRIKLSGDVKVGDLELGKAWPSREGGRISLIKGLGAKFSVPTPVPGVTAFAEISGSLGVKYGVGPLTLKAASFDGSLYPFEDDPKITARLRGKLVVPGYGELYGTFGAKIGAELLLGAAGAKGGIEITPALWVGGEAGVDVDASYDEGGFSFDAEAYAEGAMKAKLGITLTAGIYGLYGLLEHNWDYRLFDFEKQLGPTLHVTFGKVGYAKNGTVTWPSVSQIRISPDSIDPKQLVQDIMDDANDEKHLKKP